jgi:hypothetical protein
MLFSTENDDDGSAKYLRPAADATQTATTTVQRRRQPHQHTAHNASQHTRSKLQAARTRMRRGCAACMERRRGDSTGDGGVHVCTAVGTRRGVHRSSGGVAGADAAASSRSVHGGRRHTRRRGGGRLLAAQSHVSLHKVVRRQRSHQRQLACQHGGCDDAGQPCSVLTRRRRVGATDAQQLQHALHTHTHAQSQATSHTHTHARTLTYRTTAQKDVTHSAVHHCDAPSVAQARCRRRRCRPRWTASSRTR